MTRIIYSSCLSTAISLLSAIILLSCHALASDVLDLSSHSQDSFKSAISEHDTILIEFFAPWCGHCKRLAPEYEIAATALKANDPPVPLAKVDCTTDTGKDVCSSFGVQGYPTLKIFKGGEFSSEYNGPRDGDGIVKYMRGQVGPASKQYDSADKLSAALEKAKEVLVLGLFSSSSDSLHSKFLKAADRLRESVNFGHVFTDSVSGVSDLKAVKALSASVPSVVLVRPAEMKNKFEPNHVVYDGDGDIDVWVKKNLHGIVGHRTQNNMGDFKQPIIVAYYDVDYIKNPKGTNYWRNRILKVAQNFVEDDLTFAISNAQAFGGEVEEFGIDTGKDVGSKDATPHVAARDKDGKKFVMKDKFSVEAFEKFVNDFKGGKLEPFLKSEEPPADQDSLDVKVAVAKNFDELVLNSDKDILIEFYAPWCGHCKKLAPTFEELGKTLKDESVQIVKMDATANDVSGGFVVHGFPTIYWYPKSKNIQKYEGGREVSDFIEYIAKHSTQELNGWDRKGKKKEGKTEL